jgi:hypothetical protein
VIAIVPPCRIATFELDLGVGWTDFNAAARSIPKLEWLPCLRGVLRRVNLYADEVSP